MTDQDRHCAHRSEATEYTRVHFAAGDFVFAHWLSNVGTGPDTAYSGAYAIGGSDGHRRLGYRLSLRCSFDAEHDYAGAAVPRGAVRLAGRFDSANEATSARILARVSSVVRTGFPAVSLADLAERSGAAGLTCAEAVAATQGSVWSLTDQFLFAGLLDEADLAATERVLAVMNHLLGDSNHDTPASDTDDEPFAAGSFVRLMHTGRGTDRDTAHFFALSGLKTTEFDAPAPAPALTAHLTARARPGAEPSAEPGADQARRIQHCN